MIRRWLTDTAEISTKAAFAVWITGLPGSGKSTLASALASQLAAQGVDAAVLESDVLRQVLTPQPRYDEGEREAFYRALAYIGRLLVEHGVPVIFDATANRRIYRDRARHEIRQFLEVYLNTPLSVCVHRDPKGIYGRAQAGGSTTVPGLQVAYEPPEHADLVVHGDRDKPEESARRVLAELMERKYI